MNARTIAGSQATSSSDAQPAGSSADAHAVPRDRQPPPGVARQRARPVLIALIEDRHYACSTAFEEHFFQRAALRPQVADLLALRRPPPATSSCGDCPSGSSHEQHVVARARPRSPAPPAAGRTAAASALSRTSNDWSMNLLELLDLALGQQLAAAEHDRRSRTPPRRPAAGGWRTAGSSPCCGPGRAPARESPAGPAGSMPLVGSSRISSLGSWTMAEASLSRCFMPVEYDSTLR